MKRILVMAMAVACFTACQEKKQAEVQIAEAPIVPLFERENFPAEQIDVTSYQKGFQHIGIPTADVQGSIDFYKTLGFTLATRHNVEGRDFAFMQLGNLLIELIPTDAPVMLNGAVDHFCIDVKQIDELYEKIKAAGYNMQSEQVNEIAFWEKGAKYFFILGPNRERIEFCEVL